MLCILVFVSFILCSNLSNAQSETNLYSFFIAGHSYGKPGVNNVGLHPPFKDKFGYLQDRTEIEFGVLLGDIVLHPTVQDWEEVDADIISLGLPIYFAAGNHDMIDRPLFLSRYGNSYFYFRHQNDLFITLDPNIDEWNISGNQLDFLVDALNIHSLTVDNIFIFFISFYG